MEYKELSKIFYMSNATNREQLISDLADKRRNESTAYNLGIQTESGELFFTLPPETMILYDHVLRTERKISSHLASLPAIAQFSLIRGLILEEIVSTHAIENIQSTRKQVEEALLVAESNAPSHKRFTELAKLYLGLQNNESTVPKTPEDIRLIYDQVVAGELPADKVPDGALFRKEGVEVTSGGIKVVHKGVVPEAKIYSLLEQMIAIVNSDQIPETISAIASHYLFEYIHPFYDGNGRTGRYLLALFLSKSLSKMTVLSLSRSIAEHANAYYEAFKSVERPMNKGEMTFFIHTMLELIRDAQLQILDKSEQNLERLKTAALNLDALSKKYNLQKMEDTIMYILVQFELFGLEESATLADIAQFAEVSKLTARKYITSLCEKQLIEEVSKKPLIIKLSERTKPTLAL